MPSLTEDAAISAAALSDDDAQPLTEAQLAAMVPLRKHVNHGGNMARKPKTWAEKMASPPAHVERLEKNFGGMPAGALILISTPQEVAAYLSEHVARGMTITVPELRVALAKAHGAVGSCPLTTSIFLRIASEAAWDEMQAGACADEVTPFWRAVDPKSDLAKKLRCGPEWLAWQRAAERT